MFVCYCGERRKQLLEKRPSAPRNNHLKVLRLLSARLFSTYSAIMLTLRWLGVISSEKTPGSGLPSQESERKPPHYDFLCVSIR